MREISRFGVDTSKAVFTVHGVDASEQPVFTVNLRRSQFLRFFAKRARTVVALQAYGGSPHWARKLQAQGHETRLLPPHYAKAHVRPHSNDPADAAAICEAVSRPSMRFVAIRTEAQQAAASLHKVRAMLVKQQTMWINHLRGMLAEYGVVVPKGPHHMTELLDVLTACKDTRLPELTREALQPGAELLRTPE